MLMSVRGAVLSVVAEPELSEGPTLGGRTNDGPGALPDPSGAVAAIQYEVS